MSDTPHKPIGPLAPQPTSVEPAAPGAQYQMPAINPGQTNGIIGLCLAFLYLPRSTKAKSISSKDRPLSTPNQWLMK